MEGESACFLSESDSVPFLRLEPGGTVWLSVDSLNL